MGKKQEVVDRSEQINTRLSKKEKNIIQGKAAAAGKTFSEWNREVMLIACGICPTCGRS